MTTVDNKFSDIDLNFDAHPNTGDIIPLKGVAAVSAAVRNIVLTNYYERPFKAFTAGDVQALLFENITPHTKHVLQQQILLAINKYEPRAQVLDVLIKDKQNLITLDSHYLQVTIQFATLDIPEIQTVDVILEKVR